MPTKTCAMCGCEFYTRSHTDYCNKCRAIHWRIANAEYRDAHREHTNQRNKQYRENNKEKIRALNKAYYQKNRDKLIADAVRRKKKIAPLETSTLEIMGQRITMYHCERLRLKAKHLPCGDRLQCWEGTPCPHIPKRKREVTFRDETTEKSWFQQSKIKPNWEELNEVSV